MRIVFLVTAGRVVSATAIHVGFAFLLQSVILPAHPTTTSAASTSSSSLSGLTTAIQRQVSAAAAAALPTTTMMNNRFPNSGRALWLGRNNQMELSPIENARRALQTTTGDVCAPIDAFEDDDRTLLQFSSNFQPTCTCFTQDSLDIDRYIEENPVPDDLTLLQDWVDDFNTYASNFEVDEQVGCLNKCSVCVSEESSPCLILEARDRTMFRAGFNFTVDEFLTVAVLPDDALSAFVLEQVTFFYHKTTSTLCYMATGSSSGKVCVTVTTDFSSEEGVAVSELDDAVIVGCAVSVDGTDCASCSVDSRCLRADCTNIGDSSSASIVLCDGEDRASFPSVFGPLYDLSTGKVNYTLGTCDGSSPTAPLPPTAPTTVTSPASSPVLAPVPRSAPVSPPLPPVPPAGLISGGVTANNGGGVVVQALPMLVVALALAALVMVL